MFMTTTFDFGSGPVELVACEDTPNRATCIGYVIGSFVTVSAPAASPSLPESPPPEPPAESSQAQTQ
jgi:hypothetical protein